MGQAVYFDESLSLEERLDAIISSSAISFAFPPEEIDDMYLVDGSLWSTLSLGDPIERCREEEGVADEDIVVDIILCYTTTHELNEWDLPETRWLTAYDFYQRRKQITNLYYYKEDLLRVTRGYHDVDFRLMVTPSEPLTEKGMIPIYATAADIQVEIDLGYKDGRNAI